MSKVTNSFVKSVVDAADKTAKVVLQERAEDFVEVATSQINVQLANSQASLVQANSNVKLAEKSLDRTNKAFENVKKALPSNDDFSVWLSGVESAKKAVWNAEQSLEAAKSQVASIEAQIVSWQEYLEIFA